MVRYLIAYQTRVIVKFVSACKCVYVYMYSFKYKQQDATLYSILYYCQCSTGFRRFLRTSSGAQKLYTQYWYMPSLLAATASVGDFQLTHTSGTVFELLMIGGESP